MPGAVREEGRRVAGEGGGLLLEVVGLDMMLVCG
jgi:hypothetical protein